MRKIPLFIQLRFWFKHVLFHRNHNTAYYSIGFERKHTAYLDRHLIGYSELIICPIELHSNSAIFGG